MRLRLVMVLLAVVVIAGLAAVLLARPYQPPVVIDGWVIGRDRTCADLGLSEPWCDDLVARAIAEEPAGSAAVVGDSLHDVGQVVTNGQLGLAAFGAGTPFGLVVIDYADGSQHAMTFGCLVVHGAEAPVDPLCPDSNASQAP